MYSPTPSQDGVDKHGISLFLSFRRRRESRECGEAPATRASGTPLLNSRLRGNDRKNQVIEKIDTLTGGEPVEVVWTCAMSRGPSTKEG